MFNIAIAGDRIFIERAEQSQARAANLIPVWTKAHEYLMQKTKRRFDAEGPGWQPLSQDWVIAKINHGWDPRILRQKGTLLDSLMNPGHPQGVHVITNDGVEFGSNLEYAATHQEGSSRVPARPFLDVNRLDRAVISKMIGDYVATPMQPGRPTGRSRAKVSSIRSGVFTSRGREMLRDPTTGRFTGSIGPDD